MKILHVISSIDPRGGGVASGLSGLSCAQVRLADRVEVLSPQWPGDDAESDIPMRESGVAVTLIPLSRPASKLQRLLSFADRAFSGAVRQRVESADIVHIHGVWDSVVHLAAKHSHQAGVPHVISPHGMLDPWSLAQRKLQKKLYLRLRMRRHFNSAAAVHYTAEEEHRLASPLGFTSPVIIEPNGLDLFEFRLMPPRGSFRATDPLFQGKLLLLFLGRVDFKKGLDLLIPAFARCGIDNAVLAIAGPDLLGYGREVQKLIAEHGVADRVRMVGMLKGAERIAALADADLFVLPSRQENFGIAVAEAMAAACPVLISDRVNIHREITEARAGFVVPLDINALAAELAQRLSDESSAERRETGQRGSAYAFEQYSWEQIATRWQDHYRTSSRSFNAAEARREYSARARRP